MHKINKIAKIWIKEGQEKHGSLQKGTQLLKQCTEDNLKSMNIVFSRFKKVLHIIC